MALDFDPRRGLFRVADTAEITENANSMEDGIYDYLVSGTVGAVASAGVGFYNTAYALGETLGLADGSGRASTFDVLNEYVSDDVANFYSRHSTGVDIAGLVAGSLVPGLGAIRAVRLAQTRGILPAAAQAATGLKNPDLVLGSKVVDSAKQAVLRGGTLSGLKNPQMYKAYALAGKQQLLENVAFEAGVLATMNQHATLNPDNLGYFESFWNAGWDGLPFLGIGTAVGTGIDIFRVRGAVKGFVAEEYARTGKYLALNVADLRGMEPGDKVTTLLNENIRRQEILGEIGEGDWFARRQWKAGKKQLDQGIMQAIGEMNVADEAGRRALEKFVAGATKENMPQVASVLAGMSKLGRVSKDEFLGLSRFYEKSLAPSYILEGTQAQQIDQLLAYNKDAEGRLRRVLGESKAKEIVGTSSVSLLEGARIQLGRSRNGAAGTAWSTNGNGPVWAFFDSQSKRFLPVYDRAVYINKDILEESLSYTNELRAKFGDAPLTLEDYTSGAIYHELGHVKNNAEDLIRWTLEKFDDPALDGVKDSITQELVQLSVRARPQTWKDRLSRLRNSSFASLLSPEQRAAFRNLNLENEAEVVDFVNNSVFRSSRKEFLMDPTTRYLMGPREILADASGMVTNPATREVAAKIAPAFAAKLNDVGGIAKAWDDTQAYFNQRTGQAYSSYMPGLADIDGKVKYGFLGGKLSATSGVLNRTIKFRDNYFNPATIAQDTIKMDFLDADAHWAMVDNTDIAKLVGKDGIVSIAENNLPLMEKLVSLYNAGDQTAMDLLDKGKVVLQGAGDIPTGVSVESLQKTLMQRKIQYRDDLALTGLYNEHEIAKILNIEVDTAMGRNSAEGWLLYGTKSFAEPEVFSVKYKPVTMAEAEASTKSLVAVDTRQQMLDHLKQQGSAELLGKLYNNLPDIATHGMQAISPLETRATLINNARNAFGSFREQAAYVGKLVNQAIVNVRQEVANSFQKYNATFNHQNAGMLRHELSNLDQILRREWYYLAETEDGLQFAVQKKTLLNKARELAKASGEDVDTIFSQISDPNFRFMANDLDSLVGTGSKFAPDAVKLSREVGDLMKYHRNSNSDIVRRKGIVAGAVGRDTALDGNVLYPPPRDLRRSQYFAFVTPKAFVDGMDPRKFMIFAETSAEYEAKVQAISNKYGGQYNIVTRQDVKTFKQYTNEYEQGLVFDDINFDASMRRQGEASELVPNQDINISGTLERYQTWHIKQEETLIRNGVELKYGEQIQALRSIDDVMTNAERSKINPHYKEKDSIWKDTVNLMLDQKSYGGFIEDMYVRINDFIGEKGSAVIDNALGVFRRGGETITQEKLNEYNRALESQGYQAPLSDVMEAVLASPDPQVSRALPSLVRTMNNLASAFMLRLDFAHSLIQLISTPILGLPVIMEAKQALRGTQAGARLQEMISVVNPTSGLREPSAMKLYASATKKFFTAEGKQFLQQMRERNIVSDYLNQYLEAMDFSQINGRHQMKAINDKIDSIAKFGSRWSGFSFSEEFTRFQIAHSVWEIGKLRGLPEQELWGAVSGAVDKVHGIYLGHQRPQLFQGVLGQAIGLYQTYFFNFAQNFTKYLADGNKAQLLALGSLQSSIFGLQSWPGFQTFNSLIGNSNRDNTDIYSATGANDPDGWGKYFLYGLGSHSLGVPIDLYTRGDLAIRNSLVVPTNPMDIPALQITAKAISNAWNTGTLLMDSAAQGDPALAGQALLHGLAHNGMNRPLQGIANIIRNRITGGSGQVYFQNSNYIDYDMANELNWGAMFARVMGTRPLNESIIMNEYFRQAAYDSKARQSTADLGKSIQLMAATGRYDADSVRGFASSYERSGGDPQNFSSYWMRQLQQSNQGLMTEFRRQQQQDDSLRRARDRIKMQQDLTPPWAFDEVRSAQP